VLFALVLLLLLIFLLQDGQRADVSSSARTDSSAGDG
jgi:hypothetical protein